MQSATLVPTPSNFLSSSIHFSVFNSLNLYISISLFTILSAADFIYLSLYPVLQDLISSKDAKLNSLGVGNA